MRFESSTEVNASPETIWRAINNPEEWPSWVPSLKKVERVTPGSLGVGTQLRIRVRAAVAVNWRMTITQFVPGQRVVMQGRVLGTRLVRYYALEPTGQTTRLVAGGEVSGLLAWLMSRFGQALSDDIVKALKRRVEEARPPEA
ncbi:MAG: hypothetical protein A2Y91_03860 [Chloroflexi bacterium RBG_13_54_8]|nr:MAG: hypothetical protein A2Y91_03860 [Chloroflexi bacterium RBG_13_54_8]